MIDFRKLILCSRIATHSFSKPIVFLVADDFALPVVHWHFLNRNSHALGFARPCSALKITSGNVFRCAIIRVSNDIGHHQLCFVGFCTSRFEINEMISCRSNAVVFVNNEWRDRENFVVNR